MLTCKDVSRDLASEPLGSATFGRRLAVRFHLVMCANCRAFAREMELLGAAARRVVSSIESLTPDDAAASRLHERLRGPLARGGKEDAGS